MPYSPDTHPDWELLLKAVCAAPDDDLPRLVAADWLDEHGDTERAEFVRLQIERERADRPELAWRERALLNHPLCGPLWAVEACPGLVRLHDSASAGSPLRDLSVSGAERVTFRRGFPFRVTCPADAWLDHGERVVPRQPVREVKLTACDAVLLERWWDAFDTLGLVSVVDLDTRSTILPTWVRDQLPGVEVRVNGKAPPRIQITPDLLPHGPQPDPLPPPGPLPLDRWGQSHHGDYT
jgi:uncharacterized protein (TIGR02996 family)